MSVCSNCGHKNIRQALYCTECGANLSGIKGKIKGISKRLVYSTKQVIDQVKTSLDNQISTYLTQIEEGTNVKIAGIKVPENRIPSVKSALESFQDRYLDRGPRNEKDYKDWLNDLPMRLEEHNCIVCFQKWQKNDDIVVCPHCNTGGHVDHLERWIISQQFCPFCRQAILKNDLIKINF